MKASIFIAVESYADKKISEIRYAERDARAFAAVLEQHGFESADREILISEQASKTTIESIVRTTLKGLHEDDTLYVYYAGRGFSKVGGDNFLTCFDTRLADEEHTSIRLSWLFQHFKQSNCGRIVLFMDSGNGGFPASEECPGICGELHAAELDEFFTSAGNCVCFAACNAGEMSHRSSDLKHGLWAYHLIQAFDGQTPTALAGYRLTAQSLQQYLSSAVTTTLRTTSPRAVQTPQMYGDSKSDFQLTDLESVFASRKAAQPPHGAQVRDSILLSESIDSVKSLSGFRKGAGHAVPDRHSGSAQSFINGIAGDDILADVENIRAALKREFEFTRRQLSVANHDGAATITTPYFNYNVTVLQDADDPGNVVWRRSVNAIVDPDKVLADEFQLVFAKTFTTVELSLRDAVDIEQLIDFIESLGSDEIGVEYDQDEGVTSCVVRIKGHQAEIKIAKHTFAVVHPRAEAPRRLVESFFNIQHALTHQHRISTIPFESR